MQKNTKLFFEQQLEQMRKAMFDGSSYVKSRQNVVNPNVDYSLMGYFRDQQDINKLFYNEPKDGELVVVDFFNN